MRIVTPTLQLSDRPAAMVLRSARSAGPVFRDTVAEQTGLSVSTVNRQVSALMAAGLLRERPDLGSPGAVGRPRLPFEINVGEFLTLGIHIGVKVTAISAHDLYHRVVGAVQIATPHSDDPESTLREIAASARRFLTKWPGKQVLWAGVAMGGHVHDGDTGPLGTVDHPRLGWTQAPVGPIVAEVTGLPVSVASHVEAMAAAELLLNPSQESSSFLYFYAREMVGLAFTVGGSVYRPKAGPPVIGHFPVRVLEYLDPHRTGQLETAVSDTGVVQAARAAGHAVTRVEDVHRLHAEGDQIAAGIMRERAEMLGRAVGLLADVFNPDHVILGGQGFTDAPQTLSVVAATARQASVAGRRDIRVAQPAGAHSNQLITVQQQAAGAVSLDQVFSDPLGAVAQST